MAGKNLFFAAFAAIAVAWAEPSVADCISACPGFRSGSSPPSHVVIPPSAMQQIGTASGPIGTTWNAPPATDRDGGSGAPPDPNAGTAGGLASVSDLNQGLDQWLAIAPGTDYAHLPPDFLTGIDQVQPAKHAKAAPPKTEVALSSQLSMEIKPVLAKKGVPGIDPMTSGAGNRSLWFAVR